MIEEFIFCLRVAFEIVMWTLGMLLFYSCFFDKNRRKVEIVVGSPGEPQNRYVHTVDRGTNTNFVAEDELQGWGKYAETTQPDPRKTLKIPLGVPLRQIRGRDRYDKTKRVAGIWPDSGYDSFPSSCVVLEEGRDSELECVANSIKERIGQNGGTLALAGCFVVIPPNALESDHEIELYCIFDKPLQHDGDYIDMTPTVKLGPNGQKFLRPITIVLPAYYDVVDPNEQPDLAIQMKQDENDQWQECKVVKSHLQKKIMFHVTHFTKFRGIVKKIQCHLLKKQLYYAAFLKRYRLEEIPRVHILVWCLCDNLPHTVQQMTAEMTEHYERVVESETLALRFGQDVNLELSGPSQIGVMPSTHTFNESDLWPPGASRKRLFNLHKPERADVDLVTFDFKMRVEATGDDNLASTRDGTGTFRWAKPISMEDPDFVYIINNSNVTIAMQS